MILYYKWHQFVVRHHQPGAAFCVMTWSGLIDCALSWRIWRGAEFGMGIAFAGAIYRFVPIRAFARASETQIEVSDSYNKVQETKEHRVFSTSWIIIIIIIIHVVGTPLLLPAIHAPQTNGVFVCLSRPTIYQHTTPTSVSRVCIILVRRKKYPCHPEKRMCVSVCVWNYQALEGGIIC